MLRFLGIAVLVCTATCAHTASSEPRILYSEPGPWVKPPPSPTDAGIPQEAPLRFIYTDTQLRILPGGQETYSAYRVQILKPEALQLGNINISWNPASGNAAVHHVKIIRGGTVTDVLKASRFKVIQREGALEQAILTGDLTATLQVPGLQLGDELEVALTMRSRDPTLGDRTYGLFQFPLQGQPGAFRFQMTWNQSQRIAFKSSRDLAVAVPSLDGAKQSISYELRDPRGVIINDGAPGRFNIRRLIEYSDFSQWAHVSTRFAPLFASAAGLSANSALKAEAAKIAATSPDPVVRAQAALQKVQDDIRYVYVGLNGGNYRPAAADDTWVRRFGDCKAKTAVLLALLRELGIDAEAVLVNASGDDDLGARLPSASVFNHVLVRATIGGKSYWLDGTRSGDRFLDMLPEPAFSWALPIRQVGAELEQVRAAPYTRPQFIGVMEMDAREGFERPAKVSLQYVMRGDEAFAFRTGLAALSAEDANRSLRSYWRQQEGWVTPESVAWHYDERLKSISLKLEGNGNPDWSGDASEGHSLSIWGAGFSPPDKLNRSREQDADAPWLTDFPRFKCWASTIRLPKAGARKAWAYDADAMNRTIGGVTYWRRAGMQDDKIRIVMSRSVGLREITAAAARAQNEAISGFNNNMSTVFEQTAESPKSLPDDASLPFGDAVDWINDDSACVATESD